MVVRGGLRSVTIDQDADVMPRGIFLTVSRFFCFKKKPLWQFYSHFILFFLVLFGGNILHRPSSTLLSLMLSSSDPELTSLARAAARRELPTQKCSLSGDAGRHGGDLKTSRRSFPVWHI